MRIPLGSFGNRPVEYVGGPRPQSGDRVGAAAAQLGANVSNTAAVFMERDDRQQELARREAERMQRAAEQVQAATVVAAYQNNAAQAHDEIARGVADGSILLDKAGGELQTKLSTAREPFSALPARVSGMAGVSAMETDGRIGRSLQGVIVKRKQTEVGASIDQFGEERARAAVREGDPKLAAEQFAKALDLAGPGTGWTAEAIAKKKQAFAETTHYLVFDSQATDALTRGDIAGIGAVLARVRSAEGEALDPMKRTQLVHQLHGWQQSLIAKGVRDAEKVDREMEKREKDAVDAYGQAVDLTLRGQYLSPEYIKRLTIDTTGTATEAAVGELLGSQAEVAGFATRSAPERAAILEMGRARGATRGIGTSPERAKFLGEMDRVDASVRSAFKENPWQAAQASGVIERVPPLDVTSPAALLGSVQARLAQMSRLEVWGDAKISPLQPIESDQVAKFARSLPADQAASLLGELGRAVGDSERIAALGKQIHDKDGNLGLAMGFAGTQTTEGRYAAELVLRGDQAIKDKAVRIDGAAESGWRATIAKTVRGAYANREIEDRVVEAAFLIAAAKNGDVDNAIRLATGGGVIDFNGSKVPMPVGYASDGGQSGAEDRFRKEIGKIDPAQLMPQISDGKVYLGPTSIAASEFWRSLPQAQLVHAGPNAYWVKAGNTLASNARGQPIVIRLP